jgi:hypothetical protein
MRPVVAVIVITAVAGAGWVYRDRISNLRALIPGGSGTETAAPSTSKTANTNNTVRVEKPPVAVNPPPPPPITKNDPPVTPPQSSPQWTALMAAQNPAPLPPFTIQFSAEGYPYNKANDEYSVRFEILAGRDCDIILLSQDGQGKVAALMPNEVYPRISVKAGRALKLPADDTYDFPIKKPFGEDRFKVIASTREIMLVDGVLKFVDTGEPLKSPSESLRPHQWTTAEAKVITDKDGNPVGGAR